MRYDVSGNQLTDDVELLLDITPPRIRREIEGRDHRDLLIEIVLDLGRPPEVRFPAGMEILAQQPVTREEIDYVVDRVGAFSDDNRAGIERTLHRISAIRNRNGAIIGITCRVGRAIIGTVDILRDVIESGSSLLLLGRPGVGKTTLLRESARVLADDLGKRVMIVDTSNEIGGDGDVPHPGIGQARRMQVPSVAQQHAVMIEAVENHMPQVVVIDEIGTEAEALAARTIAERGVRLIATAHGNTLANLLQNPTLADLIGGIQPVTLSDEEARRRGCRKTVLERKAPPTFDVLVEIQGQERIAVHHQVAGVVDATLRGLPPTPELRTRTSDGRVEIEAGTNPVAGRERSTSGADNADGGAGAPGETYHRTRGGRKLQLFTYGVSRERLERAIEKLRVPAEVVADPNKAGMILTLKSQEKRQPRRVRELKGQGVPLRVLRSNTIIQLENFLRTTFASEGSSPSRDAALDEAEAAIERVLASGQPVELTPQAANLRALQHQLARRAGLMSESKGKGPSRRVVFSP